ncbi:MAG: hypothetical protein WCD79_16365 [Chthoniobacteraceae bacterium]
MTKISRYIPILLFLLAGCGEQKVTVYDIPKEEAPQTPQVEAASPASEITWTAPQGWKEQAATAMRQGSFLVGGENGTKADVSIVGFPGDAGGDLANVNRWRGQVNLPPIDETILNSAQQKIDMSGTPASLFELNEKPDGSGHEILATILHREDKTWFFKMTGDATLVKEQKDVFLAFLNSIRFASDKSGVQASGESAPKPVELPVEPASKPTWKLPPGWQEQPASGMRLGSFAVVEGEGKVDISLVVLTGDAGGLTANVNRWRGQLSLASQTDADVAASVMKLETAAGDQAAIVDIAGKAPGADSKSGSRILGAIIERGDKTWFVKATGEDSLVEKHKSEFLDLVKSLQFPDHG